MESQVIEFVAVRNKLKLIMNDFLFLEVIENDDNFSSCTIRNFDSENEKCENFGFINKYDVVNAIGFYGKLIEYIPYSYYQSHLLKKSRRSTVDYQKFLFDLDAQIAEYVMKVSYKNTPYLNS